LDFFKNDIEGLKIIDPSKISLTTSDGEVIDLENLDDQQTKINNNTLVNQNVNTLYYKNDPTSKEIKYNTLKVPYGKIFNIELSDGTKVYLNSGTSLRFPVNFIGGHDREVFIEGEAFFEVTKSKLSQFKVSSNNTSVNVYGTKFNFKHFPEDNFSEVILTEGSLGVSKINLENDGKILVIKPGEKAKVLFDEDKIERSRVNVKLYTSWINGRVAFRNESLPNLIQKLERIYNVIIINSNDNIADKKFTATILYKEESINEVLSYLSQVYGLEYQILDNKILIK
jgi:ferric-dicitrate binding protein FerR (iron transport regulator)